MPSAEANAAALELHPEYSVEWWETIAHKSLQYQNLFCQACDERVRIANIIDRHFERVRNSYSLAASIDTDFRRIAGRIDQLCCDLNPTKE